MLVIGLLLGRAGSSDKPSHSSSASPLAPVSVAAPSPSGATAQADCAKVIGALPLVLDGQKVRAAVSRPASPYIVAWGDPAIVLRCGVARPASLKPGSTDELQTANQPGHPGPLYEVSSSHGANVWTTVDRPVYIEITVPAKYNSAPLPTLSTTIAATLPAVCKAEPLAGEPAVPDSQLCSHRK